MAAFKLQFSSHNTTTFNVDINQPRKSQFFDYLSLCAFHLAVQSILIAQKSCLRVQNNKRQSINVSIRCEMRDSALILMRPIETDTLRAWRALRMPIWLNGPFRKLKIIIRIERFESAANLLKSLSWIDRLTAEGEMNLILRLERWKGKVLSWFWLKIYVWWCFVDNLKIFWRIFDDFKTRLRCLAF